MHIFESQTVRDVIHALPIPIVAETLGLYHFVDFFLGCQSLTVYVWLRMTVIIVSGKRQL